MTELESTIALELGASTEQAAVILLPAIQKNVTRARAELIRSGVSEIVANSSHVLVEDAITTFCLSKMGDSSEQEKNLEIFQYQQDNLRKSTIVIKDPEEQEEQDG